MKKILFFALGLSAIFNSCIWKNDYNYLFFSCFLCMVFVFRVCFLCFKATKLLKKQSRRIIFVVI